MIYSHRQYVISNNMKGKKLSLNTHIKTTLLKNTVQFRKKKNIQLENIKNIHNPNFLI